MIYYFFRIKCLLNSEESLLLAWTGHVVPELYVAHKYALSETVLSLGNLLYRMVEGQSALENNPRFDSNRCSKGEAITITLLSTHIKPLCDIMEVSSNANS